MLLYDVRSKSRKNSIQNKSFPETYNILMSDSLRKIYKDYGQEQVFDFLDRGLIPDSEQEEFLKSLSLIDVPLVNELFTATSAASSAPAVSELLEPCKDVTRVSTSSQEQLSEWRNEGLRGISLGKFAVLILAGGQGTRLGSDRPKGEYNIGLPSGKCIFQLQAERVLKLREEAKKYQQRENSGATSHDLKNVSLPVYVMTSPMTDSETRAFFESKSFFGLPREDVRFFCQGTLPCLHDNGKIMLESAAKVAEAPDGNGGIYRALHLSGCIADMRKRGVEGVHVFSVDNVIIKVGDPLFLGFCYKRGADVGSKACPKAGPHEKVGVLCKRGGRYTVVEYSEMDKASAELRDTTTNELVYNAGNICIHYYSTDFLEKECSPAGLPKVYHFAKKAIPFADPETGKTLTKEQMAKLGKATTGVKMESFIFDVFPQAKHLAALEIERSEEFAPVKNAPGSADDSPDTAREMIYSLHKQWLKSAGALVSAAVVEVSPLLSYGGEGLEVFKDVELSESPCLCLRKGETLPPTSTEVNFESINSTVEKGKVGNICVYRVSTGT
jgi:UDP-N-acetylglucosamine/UDP-N-acetylgalactosamine diphosphorylase